MKRRRLLVRLALVLVWFLLGSTIFIFNRGHTLLVDNRNLQEEGIRAPDMIAVSIDGGYPLEFFRGDRDRYTLGGSTHRIRIEFSDGTAPFEGAFTLPIRDDMYILSVPKMLNGIEPFVEVFHTVQENRARAEEEIPAAEDPFFIE
jgi:hypothetical protein